MLWQIYLFEGQHLAQTARLRPWLESLCAALGCELPPFKDLGRLRILDRALNRVDEQRTGLEFRLSFANESSLPQAFPAIQLVLNELDGSPIAERLFEPQDYLPEWRPGLTMPVGQPFEIRLALAKPSREVGGFTVRFQ